MALPVQPLRQLDGVLQGAARVGGDQIGHQILVLAVAAVELEVLLTEFLIDLNMGLAHVVQGVGHAVLRGHLQLAGDVVLDQVGEELTAGVLHEIVEADAGADKNFFHPRDGAQLAKQQR